MTCAMLLQISYQEHLASNILYKHIFTKLDEFYDPASEYVRKYSRQKSALKVKNFWKLVLRNCYS